MLYSEGCRPKRRCPDLLWRSKSDVINVVCIFDVASPVSYGEKTDFHAFRLLYPAFSCHARARGALCLAEISESDI